MERWGLRLLLLVQTDKKQQPSPVHLFWVYHELAFILGTSGKLNLFPLDNHMQATMEISKDSSVTAPQPVIDGSSSKISIQDANCDDTILSNLGHEQLMVRKFGFWSMLALAFSILGTWGWYTTVLGQ
jgi:hypothetical protein